ncbi:ParB/RepB/Spo0J family partition protein [Aliikangiella coralliicola]|uniref:Probable chromosome-partitioning protein ParB n=1 Tax=Aliikangiella coralliicola TaxID=2592383 RepID=A0A545UGJ2_9GAMM|nr:ParB/RepB/Spo0J family partition protein [Aliikangiella coralliicola]TQV88602.1 ParB/RepB/Spo0J family partition protein [Aliikangiella coralliicola]
MKKKLGRSPLDAFLSKPQKDQKGEAAESAIPKGELQKLPVELLQPGQYQPRKIMTDDALEELASSIKAQGIIQPVVVRSIGKDKYEIIAGERRWRASQIAQLDEIPCLVKQIPDEAAIAMALIENIQREDLNAMEEAVALQRLMQEFSLTHQQTADAVGKSRTTVTNLLRLLSLTEPCRVMLERGDLEMGHARALLSLPGDEQTLVARTVVSKELTVRETEKLVRKHLSPIKPKNKTETADPHIEQLERAIGDKIGAPISIQHGNKGKGKISIQYNSLDELDGILRHMGIEQL